MYKRQEQIVFSKQDYFEKIDTELHNEIKWIIPNAQKNVMEPILLTLEAGGSTYPDNPHEGEEFGYVIQGSVSIHRGAKTYKAKKGESFYFVADKKHYLTSKGGAVIPVSYTHLRMLRRHAVIYIQNFAPGCQRQLPAEQFVSLRALFDKSASVQIDHQRNLFFTALCAYKKRL